MVPQGKRPNPKQQKKTPWSLAAFCEGAGILLISLTAFLLLALLSFHPDDPSFNQTGDGNVHNLAGLFGAYFSDLTLQTMGYASGWLIFLLGLAGIQLLQYGKKRKFGGSKKRNAQITTAFYWDRILVVPVLLVVTAIASALFSENASLIMPSGPGGVLGTFGAIAMRRAFGPIGSLFLLIPLGILGLMVLTHFSLLSHWERFKIWLNHRKNSPAKQTGTQVKTKETNGMESKNQPKKQVIAKGSVLVAYLLAALTALAIFLWRLLSTLKQKIQAVVMPPSTSPEWLKPMGNDPEPEFFPRMENGHREPTFEDFSDTEQLAPLAFREQNLEPKLEDDHSPDEKIPQMPALASPPDLPQKAQQEAKPLTVFPLPVSELKEESKEIEKEVKKKEAPKEVKKEKPKEVEKEESKNIEKEKSKENSSDAPLLLPLPPNPIFLWPEDTGQLSDTHPLETTHEVNSPEEHNPPPPAMVAHVAESVAEEKLEKNTADPLLPEVCEPQEKDTADPLVPEVCEPQEKGTADPLVPPEVCKPLESPLPPFSLMVDPGPKRFGETTREELNLIARTLEQKLADFKIKGQIVDVLPGPVVTTFELDPAPGLRAAKVIGLADDLARSISVPSVRVVGNVPGKTVLGIEIPNLVRQTVYMKEILSSETFRKIGGPLAVALGSDIFGNPVVGNLAKMPHLLVAGTTGSGKSVAVNAMICSILFSARPDEVRFLMVDPKMLELSIYEGIPHLLAPVVTDVHKAANLLKWAVGEMENRYRLMSELGVRSLTGFNDRVLKCIETNEQPTRRIQIGFDPETGHPVEQEEPIPLETKPLIVIVIDELADLMIQVGKEVEPAIARLAQMARAAGLHLIIATQRPSVDVITGLIKANFPTRLAFQVSSKIDSRTILDAMGADRLLGMGDGLFLPPGTSHLKRIHAPFVSDKEVHDLVDFLKSTGSPAYDDSVLIQRSTDGNDGGDGGGVSGNPSGEAYDELYDKAVGVVIRARKVSVSMVQRHFKIGYNRAARIVERMELDGVVSEANGAGKREVLAPESGGEA